MAEVRGGVRVPWTAVIGLTRSRLAGARRWLWAPMRAHPLFDPDHYLAGHPDAPRGPRAAYRHWTRHGRPAGDDPNAWFDTSWYLERYPDVAAAGVDPLDHYLRHGAREGRDPSPRFHTDWYLRQNPDVAAAGMNPLQHYLRHGIAEGRRPTWTDDARGSRPPRTTAARSGADAQPPAQRVSLRRGWERSVTDGTEPGAHVLVLAPEGSSRRHVPGRALHWLAPLDGDRATPSAIGLLAAIELARAADVRHVFVPDAAEPWLLEHPAVARTLGLAASETAARAPGRLVRLAPDGSTLDEEGVDALVDRCADRLGRDPVVLDWTDDGRLAGLVRDLEVIRPPAGEGLPYLDRTIDVVAVAREADAGRWAEAHRVATSAVLRVHAGGEVAAAWMGEDAADPDLSVVVVGQTVDDAALRRLRRVVGRPWRDLTVAVTDPRARMPTLRVDAGARVTDMAGAGADGRLMDALAAVEGDRVLLVDSSMLPLPGSVAALTATLRIHADAAAIGGMIVDRAGRVVHAGGMRAGHVAHDLGAGDPRPDRPDHRSVRRVAFCSHGLLLTDRRSLALWPRSGAAWDWRGTVIEYCRRLDAAGLPVVYQPESVVVRP